MCENTLLADMCFGLKKLCSVYLILINRNPLDQNEWNMFLYKQETSRSILFHYQSKEIFFFNEYDDHYSKSDFIYF